MIRDALKKHSTYEALADSVSMRVLDRWSVKCHVRSKRFATRGKARLTNAQNYNTHVCVCVYACVCVCVMFVVKTTKREFILGTNKIVQWSGSANTVAREQLVMFR